MSSSAGAKVLKQLLRQSASLAEAAAPAATTSTQSDSWKGFSDNMKPAAALHGPPSFRAPVVSQATANAWAAAPRRAAPAPPLQLPHIGSSALPPLQRYIDQLRLAQNLVEEDKQHQPAEQPPHPSHSQAVSDGRRPASNHQQQHAALPQHQQRQIGHAAPGPQGARRGRASSAAVQLNKEIMAATTTSELLALVRMRGSQMDFFNISSAISRTPKLAGVQAFDGGHGTATAQHPPLDTDGRQLAAGLAELMCEHINQFDARGLANSAWAFGKLRFMPTPSLPALIASQAVAKIDGFCAQNISNLAWAFVYMHHRDERVLSVLASKICTKIDEFKPQELANVLWAFASLEFPDPDMMHIATQRAARIAPLFKEQELSNAIWAMGRLQFHSPQVFSSLLGVAASKLHLFLPQGIANIAWAMAVLQHHEPAMLARMASQCRGNLAAYDAQALCNLAWSFASLAYYDRALMEEVVSEALQRVERLSPHNLASLLWACAQLGHSDARLVSVWAQQVQSRIGSFEPAAAASLLLSFHQLGCVNDVLYAALAGVVNAKPDACPTHELVGAVWALTASHSAAAAAPFLERLGERLEAGTALDGCDARTCAMAMWSFAAQHQYPGAVAFESLLQRVAAAGNELEPGAAAEALWACARSGHAAGPQVRLLASRALALAPAMAPHELSDIAWALSTLQLLDDSSAQLLTTCLQQQRQREAVAGSVGSASPTAAATQSADGMLLPQQPAHTLHAGAQAGMPQAPLPATTLALAELQQLMAPAGSPGLAVQQAQAHHHLQQPQLSQNSGPQAAAAAALHWQQALSGLPAPMLAAALLAKLNTSEDQAAESVAAMAGRPSPLLSPPAAQQADSGLRQQSMASLRAAVALTAEAFESSGVQPSNIERLGSSAASEQPRTLAAAMAAAAQQVDSGAATEQLLDNILALPGRASFEAATGLVSQQQQQAQHPQQMRRASGVAISAADAWNWGAAPIAVRPPVHQQHAALLHHWAAAAHDAGAGEHSGQLGGNMLLPSLGVEDSLGAAWESPELLLPRGLFSEGLEEVAPVRMARAAELHSARGVTARRTQV